MSYADDFEDIGGYLADMDYRAEVCDEHDGDCNHCPLRRDCPDVYRFCDEDTWVAKRRKNDKRKSR